MMISWQMKEGDFDEQTLMKFLMLWRQIHAPPKRQVDVATIHIPNGV